jgi:hypothetical protein
MTVVRTFTNNLDFGKYSTENNCINEQASIAFKNKSPKALILKLGNIDIIRQIPPIEIGKNKNTIFKKKGLLNFIRISKKTIIEIINIEKYK